MQILLEQELGILHRLGAGRSIEAFQRNLLEELRSVIDWDHAIFADPPVPCPSGIWQQQHIPNKTWQAWCQTVAESRSMNMGLLFTLDLSCRSIQDVQDNQSLGILFLRQDQPFTPSEILTLTHIHLALQQLLDQAIMLETLVQHGACGEVVDNSMQAIEVTGGEQKAGRMEIFVNEKLKDLGLTRRQAEVIHLVMKGKEISTIALSLGCSNGTVRKHLENLYRRLGVQTRTAAIAHILEKIGIV